MNDLIVETGLSFFGRMSASISHEIKNRMAVIYEKAGLMGDLISINKGNGGINLDRIEGLAEEVKEQINLMEIIIKTMNQFSHSVDSIWASIDTDKLLQLFISLTKRLVDMKGARLEIVKQSNRVILNTSPFMLINLLWLCLEEILKLNPDKELKVGYENSPGEICIWFGTAVLDSLSEKSFSDEPICGLSLLLGVTIDVDRQQQRLLFVIPKEKADKKT